MPSPRVVFRIVYRTLYFIIYICLLGLLLVTPADAIAQALRSDKIWIIWTVAVFVLITVVVMVFIYALRLYINNTVLASIPKMWVPVEKQDLDRNVYKMINAGLKRSAAIAFRSRPRVEEVESPESGEDRAETPALGRSRTEEGKGRGRIVSGEEDFVINVSPVWGEIEHPGWASPNSKDLPPSLQYDTVISELPNLTEAKALTLAPPDPSSESDPPSLDPSAVTLLQRAPNMTLRDYIVHLTSLEVIAMDQTAIGFLTLYEHARFSTRAVSKARFRDLMHHFAELLRGMQPLDPAVLDDFDDGSFVGSVTESDIDDNAPGEGSPSTPDSRRSRSFAPRSRERLSRLSVRDSSANTGHQYRTAPNTPRAKTSRRSRSRSGGSFAQTRQPYTGSQSSSSSVLTLSSDGSGGSVIRLGGRSDSRGRSYVLRLGDTNS